LRRLQPRHAPAFLVNQDWRGSAQYIANIIRERPQLRWVLDIARKQNGAERRAAPP
jgi:hypothetical protein